MPKNFSLYIRDKKLDESAKVIERQNIIKAFRKKNSSKIKSNTQLDNLFEIGFPVDRAGSNNCENMIGSVELPVGLAGPVNVSKFVTTTVNRKFIDRNSGVVTKKSKPKKLKNVFVPLATTEGALVASVNRGCKALDMSKNLSVVVKKIGMTRALLFDCSSTFEAYKFLDWVKENRYKLIEYCESTSNHLKFLSYQSFIRGRHVYLRFSFDTDQAMGMNMVSIALKYTWSKIKKYHKKVKLVSLSSNVCADKKDSVINRIFGRGYNVELEVFLSKEVLKNTLGVSAKDLVKSHVAKNLVGSNVAGSMAQNMHVANALAAFYIATGQDPAHVVNGSEASVTFEEEKDDIYAALTLPSISVGSVGGGTWFPKQSQARSLISAKENVTADLVALSAGIGAFAGEISGLAALATQSLADAHRKLAR